MFDQPNLSPFILEILLGANSTWGCLRSTQPSRDILLRTAIFRLWRTDGKKCIVQDDSINKSLNNHFSTALAWLKHTPFKTTQREQRYLRALFLSEILCGWSLQARRGNYTLSVLSAAQARYLARKVARHVRLSSSVGGVCCTM